MQNLALPDFDPKENPRKLRDDLMAKNDEEYERQKEEAAKKRDEIR